MNANYAVRSVIQIRIEFLMSVCYLATLQTSRPGNFSDFSTLGQFSAASLKPVLQALSLSIAGGAAPKLEINKLY